MPLRLFHACFVADPVNCCALFLRESQILRAARSCIVALGYERATVRDIAEEAGVSTGTIVHYFGDKDTMLEAALLDKVQDTGLAFRAALSGAQSAWERLERLVEASLPETVEVRTEWCLWLTFWGEVTRNERLRAVSEKQHRRWTRFLARIISAVDPTYHSYPGRSPDRWPGHSNHPPEPRAHAPGLPGRAAPAPVCENALAEGSPRLNRSTTALLIKELLQGSEKEFMENRARRQQPFATRTPAVWKVGDSIDLAAGKYKVMGILGEGGMGIVYKIQKPDWNIELAMKFPKAEIFTRAEGKENFTREAETWINLGEHPHITSCSFVQMLGGIPHIFAEYVEGGSLADWIRRRKLYEGGTEQALARMLDVAIQFAWGLHYAHQQGLVHQDVKPANVLLTRDGVAKVTDFGLAKARILAGEAEGQAQGNQQPLVSVGGMTPAYCSPEQAARQALNHTTDVWSWGLSVLEMFSGGVTWSIGVVAREALAAHERQDPAIPLMPAAIVKLLNRCFEPDAGKRPATMEELAAELQAIYASLVGRPYPRQTPPPVVLEAGLLLNQAFSLQELGQLEEALALIEQAIRLDPSSSSAHNNKGSTLRAMGRHEEALAAYEQAIRLNPSSASAYTNKGVLLLVLKRREEALAALEQAIRLDPARAMLYNNQGGILNDLGRFQEALSALDQAIRLDPSLALAYVNKGSALHNLGRREEALAVYDQAIRLDPQLDDAHYNKGRLLDELGRYEQALASYDQAIRLNPTFANAFYNKGNTLQRIGRVREALEAYDRTIQLDPPAADAYSNKGLMLQKLGQLREALAALDQALRLDPTRGLAHLNRGLTLDGLGRPREALEAYEQAIRFAPNDARAYSNKGVVLCEFNRHEEALTFLDQAIRLNPTFAGAYMNKGTILRELKRFKEALACHEQSTSLDPTSATAQMNKGLVLDDLKRYQEALLAFDEAIRLNPRYVNAYMNKSKTLFTLRRFQEALEAVDQVIYLNPRSAQAYNNKGILLQKLRRRDEAKQAFRIAASLGG